jgi:hypothetical protein
MTTEIRHLAARSSDVYEHSMLEYFSEEFRKQEQIQKIKFAIIVLGFLGLFGLTILVPMTLSHYLSMLLG